MQHSSPDFRQLCAEHGIAVARQRQVLFEVMRGMEGHPSPEEVYARVKKKVPAISLATVYKDIHLFVESGIFRTPDGYRHMDGFSSHTFSLINAKGELFYCKWHFKTKQ